MELTGQALRLSRQGAQAIGPFRGAGRMRRRQDRDAGRIEAAGSRGTGMNCGSGVSAPFGI